MNKFLNEFKDRGYFYQCTNENELSNLLDNQSINAYIGFAIYILYGFAPILFFLKYFEFDKKNILLNKKMLIICFFGFLLKYRCVPKICFSAYIWTDIFVKIFIGISIDMLLTFSLTS